MLVYNIHNKFV